MGRLRELLRTHTTIEIRETRFDTRDGIPGLGEDIFVSLCPEGSIISWAQ